MPTLDAASPLPRYPTLLLSGRIEGRVRAAYVVDTTGAVEAPSIRVLYSTHPLFTFAVRRALQSWRFTSGRRGRRSVRTELQQDFAFVVPQNSTMHEIDSVSAVLIGHGVTPDGVPELRLTANVEDTAVVAEPPAPVRDSLARAALRVVARDLIAYHTRGRNGREATSGGRPERPTFLLCIETAAGRPLVAEDEALLREFTHGEVRAIALAECPATRARMFSIQGEPPPPPDSVPFVEPRRLRIRSVGLRRSGRPQVDLVVEHMLGGNEMRCVIPATALPMAVSAMRCYSYVSWVH